MQLIFSSPSSKCNTQMYWVRESKLLLVCLTLTLLSSFTLNQLLSAGCMDKFKLAKCFQTYVCLTCMTSELVLVDLYKRSLRPRLSNNLLTPFMITTETNKECLGYITWRILTLHQDQMSFMSQVELSLELPSLTLTKITVSSSNLSSRLQHMTCLETSMVLKTSVSSYSFVALLKTSWIDSLQLELF